MRKSQAVKALQLALQSAGHSIVADGILGPNTIRALEKKGGSAEELLGNVGTYVDTQVRQYKLAHHSGESRWMTIRQLLPFIEEAAMLYNIPSTTLHYFLNKEARVRNGASGKEYDAYSRSHTGKHFGLMQLAESAWKDAVKYDKKSGVRSLDANYSRARFNPRESIKACAAYVMFNRSVVERLYGYEGPYTEEMDYALYNQGASFFKKSLTQSAVSVLGSQSPDANRALVVARNQIRQNMSTFIA